MTRLQAQKRLDYLRRLPEGDRNFLNQCGDLAREEAELIQRLKAERRRP